MVGSPGCYVNNYNTTGAYPLIMRKLRESDREMRWVQPEQRERRFELRSGDDVVARLDWQKMLGTLATARTAAGEWTFKRSGFLSPRVTARAPGSDADVAIFVPAVNGNGTLETVGRKFAWKNVSFWGNSWAFLSQDGKPLVTFKPGCGLDTILRLETQVSVAPDAAGLPELPLLLALGWYLMMLMADDTAAAVAATTMVVL